MEKLLTRWGKKLNKDLPLNDYPRPQLRRDSFINLNGQWNYAIYKKSEKFGGYQGTITVPFSPECILSGVEKTVSPDDVLYYQRSFELKKSDKRVILHFGAVDYECKVLINEKTVGSHKGGYLPFDFDITDYLRDGQNNIYISVTDPTDTGVQARGKQTFKRGGIWYTPQSGIWQTVWLEEVPANYIKSIKMTPDIDAGTLDLSVDYSGNMSDSMKAVVSYKGEKISETEIKDGKCLIKMENFDVWSPENPCLYDLTITAGNDKIESYFAMRKFSVGKDDKGVSRIMLNNKPYFMNGLLDQGYWSDGMYTAPSDEALIYDIQTMKDLGFNTLRKHIKIEPMRWYYHCDRLGMIVWQDMINGGRRYNPFAIGGFPLMGTFLRSKHIGMIKDDESHRSFYGRQDEEGIKEYYEDAEGMIKHLYNVPSLALWTPHNEGWGQFDCVKVFNFFRSKDPTRLIDHASGWVDHGAGDVNSFHIYFSPFVFPKFSKDDERPIALTEYGGYSIKTKNHVFNPNMTFGYRVYKKQADFDEAIRKLFEERLYDAMVNKGLSAAIYTEVSDVEDELNGLLTYDREVTKVTPEVMKKANALMKL